MNAIFVFIATFINTFALGFQSRNVNQGHYKAAIFTSVAIGAGNLFVLRMVPNGDTLASFAYIIASPLAIVSSMYIHERFMNKEKNEPRN